MSLHTTIGQYKHNKFISILTHNNDNNLANEWTYLGKFQDFIL